MGLKPSETLMSSHLEDQPKKGGFIIEYLWYKFYN